MGINGLSPNLRPARVATDNSADPAPTPQEQAAAPAAGKPGWLAGATARAGRAISNGAGAAQGWVSKSINTVEKGTEQAGTVPHYVTSVVGGFADGVSGMVTGTAKLAGGTLQLADAATRGELAATAKTVAQNPGAVGRALVNQAIDAVKENPGHAIGQVESLVVPGLIGKLAKAGDAAEVAAQTGKSVEALMAGLANATKPQDFIEAIGKISRPEDMQALATKFISTDGGRLPPSIVTENMRWDAMDNLKTLVFKQGHGRPDLEHEWVASINRAGNASAAVPWRYMMEPF
jgi:hypothetical protein